MSLVVEHRGRKVPGIDWSANVQNLAIGSVKDVFCENAMTLEVEAYALETV